MAFRLAPINPYVQGSPALYFSAPNSLRKSGEHLSGLGDRTLVSGGVRALESVERALFPSLAEHSIKWSQHVFDGYPTSDAVESIADEAKAFDADYILGIGGGRSIDAAKAAASVCGVPVVTIPTIAATCAAASGVSVIYDDEGRYVGDFHLSTNPHLVLVDSQIIAEAPVEYLESGIFDALSKWYEGRLAVARLEAPDVSTLSAIQLARLLNDLMTAEALEAVRLVKERTVGDALVRIIDLNVYVTSMIQSLGKVSTRGAAAHSIHNGLTMLPQSHSILHGIKVGYGIIVQLYLEQRPAGEIAEVTEFFRRLGLDPSLRALGLPVDAASLTAIAEKAAADQLMKNMPHRVTPEMIVEAMKRLEQSVERQPL